MKLPWMSRADRRRWRSAKTIADLGELTAQWLEGDIASQPAYVPNCGPDQESADLIPSLAALNRAGFMTTCSQPGTAGIGHDDGWWTQHAAVEGYLTDRTLYRQLLDAGALAFTVVVDDPQTGRHDSPAVVTSRDGVPYTAFGIRLSAHEMRAQYGILRTEARHELEGAIQLALIAPYHGPAAHRALWRALDQVTGLQAPDEDMDQDELVEEARPGH